MDVFWKFDGTAVDMWHGGAVRATEAIPSNGERARGLQGVRLSPDPELLPVAEVLLGLGEGGGGREGWGRGAGARPPLPQRLQSRAPTPHSLET